MVKVLGGACVAGVVTSTSLPPEIIAGCTIIGEGRGTSTGFIILSDVGPYYVPQITGDITTVIGQITANLTLISAALAGVQSSLVANDHGVISAAPVAAAVAGLATSIAALNALILIQR